MGQCRIPLTVRRVVWSLLLLFAAACSSEKTEELKTFSALYDDYLKKCADCHTVGTDTEMNFVPGLDFSTADKAFASLNSRVRLSRSEGCEDLGLNYVVAGQPSRSFLLAVVDLETNENFESATGKSCAPAKHTSNLGGPANSPSGAVVAGLKTWITDGAKR
jgi:hypothetical protein